MSNLADVYSAFKQLTGLDWYPDPAQLAKHPVSQEAADQVDAIIAIQAKNQGVAHSTAQEDRQASLSADAEEAFAKFSDWVVEVKKIETV